MSIVSPYMAASLARDVYDIQDADGDGLEALLIRHTELSQKPTKNKVIKAEVGLRLINTRDNFCLCVRGANEYKNDIFMIFRGTTPKHFGADFFTDARMGAERSFGNELVHIGFNHAFSSLRMELQAFIDQYSAQVERIHCIGHSLGGAVATLAASWAKKQTGKAVRLYTFGAPKVGFLDAFSINLTKNIGHKNIHRVYHNSDPVPMVPLYPFTHAPLPGYGHYINYSSQFITPSAHLMRNYVESVKDKGWLKLSVSPPVSTHEQAVEQWLQQEVPINPLNPQTWEWINAGLAYVIRNVLLGAAALLQSTFTVGFTLADKIAWLLYQGISLAISAGVWILRLIRKMMQAIGMKVVETAEQLTEALMRNVLQRVMQRLNEAAQQAVSQMIVR